MQIKKNTKVKIQYRPELDTGAVLQVAEASGDEHNVDVVFEKDGKRFLETFPQILLTPVADTHIFQTLVQVMPLLHFSRREKEKL